MKFRFGSASQEPVGTEVNPDPNLASNDDANRTSGPGIAERARTALAAASSVRLGVAGGGVEVVRHVIAVDGSVVLVVGENSPGVDRLEAGTNAALPVQLRAVDVAPVVLPERIRATVVLAGRLQLLTETVPAEVLEHLRGPGGVWEDRPLLRFVPRRVVAHLPRPGVDVAPTEIDLAAWSAARTDPLVGIEGDWLEHLVSDHADVLDALGAALSGSVHGRARPVSLDRHGIVLWLQGRHRRLDFAAPVACGCDLSVEFGDLLQRVLPYGPRPDCVD